MIDVQFLQDFEKEVEHQFTSKKIRGPIHLSGGNEQILIDIFKNIVREDWVFSTYRNHFHALLHGVPENELMNEILAGRNMNFSSVEHRFFTSAIVGGTLPIAVGTAAAIKRNKGNNKVWCFIGDMAATTGIFHESRIYAEKNSLPIKFVIEDNGMSANSPTKDCWSPHPMSNDAVRYYKYERIYPHAGANRWVDF